MPDTEKLPGQIPLNRELPPEQQIILEMPFTDLQGETLTLGMEKGVFSRFADYLSGKNLFPVSGRKAVIFAAVGAAAVAAGAYLAGMIEENQSAAVVVSEDKSKFGLPLSDKQKEEFTAVFELNNPLIAKYYRIRLLNKDQIEELTQEVFFRAHNRFAAFNPDSELDNPHLPWLYRIARNLLFNYRRDYFRNPEYSMEELPFNLYSAAKTIEGNEYLERRTIAEEERRRFGEIFSGLPVRFQTILFLEIVTRQVNEDKKNETIGKIMGIKEGAVKSLKARAFHRLGKEWEKRVEP
ncbi:MAG: hypothetical protein UV73_C0008G0040 [Candidatus Gottesmanbacteria bacterium GW2011_GWA2_43_14]|uniref:RNA polymerase sigma-70 region 2 domain-containing protein n=1 Tax=Candidatus Gottesmanbacteria bacterium GW2011_GWA2_43_14 TaxID=1618443 RepID=A0A0G1DI55_9BACT|nr:MAG: hypothetical protein UV73_C0008G0040 [Candidatus Gottesmanbacteria bacterium GW2011_GWA2_43_14]